MTAEKIDYLIEAVRYQADGSVDFVRLYERRGASFSDRELFTRDQIVEVLKNRKLVFTGKRLASMASTFEVMSRVNFSDTDGKSVIYTLDEAPTQDTLENVPIL